MEVCSVAPRILPALTTHNCHVDALKEGQKYSHEVDGLRVGYASALLERADCSVGSAALIDSFGDYSFLESDYFCFVRSGVSRPMSP